MSRSEPQIDASFMAGLDDVLRAYSVGNLSLAGLMEQVGIARPLPDQPLQRISLNRYADLLELAAKSTGDPHFGLAFAKSFPIGAIGVVGFLCMNAPNLKTVLAILTRHAGVYCDVFDLSYRESEGVGEIAWKFGPGLVVPHLQLLEFLLGLFVVRSRMLIGEKWFPETVAFAYRKPDVLAPYQQLFGRNLSFDAPFCKATVDASAFLRPTRNTDVRLYKALSEHATKELDRLHPSKELLKKIEGYVIERISLDGVTLEGAADALDIPAQEIQADLRREGVRLDTIVSEVRQRLAERYLRDTDLPMTEIALMLGFSELSAFTRAARNWFKCAPSDMRSRLRAKPTND